MNNGIKSAAPEVTIGVAIPAFNAGPWIAETLQSVLGQTQPPGETIVVDDGSEDDTADVVRRFGDSVVLIRQENLGAPAAYDRAIRAGSAEYVAMCPADDIWEPQKLEWQRDVLERHPDIDVAFGHLRYFGERSGEHSRPTGHGRLDGRALLRTMYRRNIIAAPTAVIRRELYERLDGFRTDILIEDYEFWMRALVTGARFYYDERVLANYRAHDRNLSRPSLALTELDYEIHKRFAHVVDPDVARRVLEQDQRLIARYHLELGRAADARSAYLTAFRSRPGWRSAAAVVALSLPVGRWAGVRRARHGRS